MQKKHSVVRLLLSNSTQTAVVLCGICCLYLFSLQTPALAEDGDGGFFKDEFVQGGVFKKKKPLSAEKKSSPDPPPKAESITPPASSQKENSENAPAASPPLPGNASAEAKGAVKLMERIKRLSTDSTEQHRMKEMERYYKRMVGQKTGVPASSAAPPVMSLPSTAVMPAEEVGTNAQTPLSPPSEASRRPLREVLPPLPHEYRPNMNGASLTLVVSEQPKRHFMHYIRLLHTAAVTQRINISKVLVVMGPPKNGQGILLSMLGESEMLNEEVINLVRLLTEGREDGAFALKPVTQLPKGLPVKSSPVWIVNDGEKEHIFEGNYEPANLFNQYGEFIAAENYLK